MNHVDFLRIGKKRFWIVKQRRWRRVVAKSKSDLMKRLRADRKAKGLCSQCGQPLPKKDATNCVDSIKGEKHE